MQIAFPSFQEMLFLYFLQIFPQRPSGYGQYIQIQVFFQKQLDSGDSSCKPEGFGKVPAAGIDIAYVGIVRFISLNSSGSSSIPSSPAMAGK